ncbi:hypothetical protein ACROSR_11370 [Roseovarius tibetensis]|uniref:hypothetical protein n=1 Tax=Roseovarius tibetensis TaxID=2685897 RepID=UPI003D7F9DC4
MVTFKISLTLPVIVLLSACVDGAVGPDKTRDRGLDAKPLTELQAGIWVDPNGCDHWIIDDGVEGYMSPRLDKYGKPVCSGVAAPNVATGDFKKGSPFADAI